MSAVSITEHWHELVTVALLGTDRREPSPAPAGEGDRAGAQAMFERLLPVLAFTSQHIDVSIQFQKRLAVRQGIFRTARVRSPEIPFDSYHERVTEDLLERALALHEEVGWRVSWR